MVSSQHPFGDPHVIYEYTRQQAIEDGVLVDVSKTVREAGVRFPVALTRAVWAQYVEVPEGVECQDEAGRLWDIVWMFRYGAKNADGDRFNFELRVRNDNRRPKRSPSRPFAALATAPSR